MSLRLYQIENPSSKNKFYARQQMMIVMKRAITSIYRIGDSALISLVIERAHVVIENERLRAESKSNVLFSVV